MSDPQYQIQDEDLIREDIAGYLSKHENKDLLRLLTCGSVDDGKSTMIGRLLYDSKMIYEDQLAAVTRDSKIHGTTDGDFDPALLCHIDQQSAGRDADRIGTGRESDVEFGHRASGPLLPRPKPSSGTRGGRQPPAGPL